MKKFLLLALGSAALVSSPALAADLYVPPPAAPAPAYTPAPAANGWDGLYLGAFAGYAQGTTDDNTNAQSYNYDGYMVGLQGGYNFHISDAIVAGISADVAYNNAKGGDVTTPTTATTTKLNWTGSVTGRVGADLNGIVPYVLGGVAFANNTLSNGTVSNDQTHTGYTVGAGVEFMLADNVSADVEYRYTDYGKRTYGLTAPTEANLKDNSIRVGLNYHFQ